MGWDGYFRELCNPSTLIAVASLIVAFISLAMAYYSARLQTETFLMAVLAGKAVEANAFSDSGKNSTETIHYQNAIASIVQATEIYDLLKDSHAILLCGIPRKEFMNVFFLQWRTDLQNKIFDQGEFEKFLIKDKTPEEQDIIQRHLKRIKDFMQESRDEFSPANSKPNIKK